MAEKKSTKKAAKNAAPSKVISDEKYVKQKFKSAECVPVKDGFAIFEPDIKIMLHSGLANNVSDAWKLAARAVM